MSADYKFLRDLSNSQLEELLRHTLEEDVSNIEYINYILGVLENREKENPENNLSDVQKAWEDFQNIYNVLEGEKSSLYDFPANESPEAVGHPYDKKGRLPFKRIVLIAIIICLCISMGASAFGYNIFQAIASWTQDIFSFSYSQPNTPLSSNSVNQDSKQTFENLQKALDANSITEIQSPTWTPEDFEQIEVVMVSHLTSKEIQAYYSYEDCTIQISVTQFTEPSYSSQYEKDENPVEEFDVNGIVHYIFTNNERSVAIWNLNSLECSIRGDITLEELKQIICSMY